MMPGGQSLDAGMKAFMSKAILTANGKCFDGVVATHGAVAAPSAAGDVNGQMLLEMRKMREEQEAKVEKKVHVNLELRVKDITLRGLPNECLPPSAATDDLATLKARAVKAGVVKPFPLMDLEKFLPSWAEEANDLSLFEPESAEVLVIVCALAWCVVVAMLAYRTRKTKTKIR